MSIQLEVCAFKIWTSNQNFVFLKHEVQDHNMISVVDKSCYNCWPFCLLLYVVRFLHNNQLSRLPKRIFENTPHLRRLWVPYVCIYFNVKFITHAFFALTVQKQLVALLLYVLSFMNKFDFDFDLIFSPQTIRFQRASSL
jgi:hypothetical protein